MDKYGFEFVIMMKDMKKFVKNLVLQVKVLLKKTESVVSEITK